MISNPTRDMSSFCSPVMVSRLSCGLVWLFLEIMSQPCGVATASMTDIFPSSKRIIVHSGVGDFPHPECI